ncbi:MAG: TonB-dependent receptor [Pseudomonadota bacterium]
MFRKSQLSLAVGAALGLSSLTSMPVQAQEPSEAALEEVVVTGSRIQRLNLVSSSPVQQLDQEQLAFSGVTRIEDVLASLPQVSIDQGAGQSIEAEGTATVELRNLGVSRTLVLIDGKRMPINSPISTESGPDLNFIPMQLVERVEVLTGGASSTYGSDAIAGVINFIMMDDFEGVKLDYQASQYRHDNSGNGQSRATVDAGFPVPTGTSNDGDAQELTFVMGGNLDQGRGNITAYASYRKVDAVTQSERDYSSCAIFVLDDGSLLCGGSGTNASGTFYFEPDGFDAASFVSGNELILGNGTPFNFAAPSYYQRPDERYNLGTMGHYELNEHVEAYTQLMYMNDQTESQFGPAGVFFDDGFTVNCDNPYLSDQQRGVIDCSDDELVGVVFGRRNVEGGPRFGEFKHDSFRGVFGLRGDINETWRYDVSYQFAEVNMSNRNGNYVDTARANNALKATTDDDGNIVCIDDSDGCVPWNIWNEGGVTQDQLDYFTQTYFEDGKTDQEVISGYVQGDLGDYGVTIPWAESGVVVVVGAEYREENLKYDPDDAAQRGDVGGLTAALVPVDGGYDVSELFIEANIPIIEGAAFAKSMYLDLGYRYSDYSEYDTDTYKIAGTWSINDSIMLRGGFNRAVRAPNIVDQFQPQNGALFSMSDDPCGNVVNGVSGRGYTFEQCARSGVTQRVWDQGGPTDSPANQYNTLEGGNTDLEPEEADTYTVGFVFTPEFVDGLTLAVDYYDIKVEGAIESIEPETTLLNCIETGNFCDLVNRNAQLNDSLWLGNAGPDNGVSALSENIGFFQVKGVDLEANYNFDVGSWGSMLLGTVIGYVDSWEQEEYPGAGVIECDGVYGGSCQTPTPEWAARSFAMWATPWDVTVNATWRYVDSYEQIGTDAPPTNPDSVNYIDLAANWQITDWVNVRGGINNVFDERPQFIPFGTTLRENGNTYPNEYDVLGQYLYLGATLTF